MGQAYGTYLLRFETDRDMNIRHLQAHVSSLLSLVSDSELVRTQFGLVGARALSQQVFPSPLFIN